VHRWDGHGPFRWSWPLSLVMAFAGHGPFRWSWPLSLVMAPLDGHGPFRWSWLLLLVMGPFAGHGPFRACGRHAAPDVATMWSPCTNWVRLLCRVHILQVIALFRAPPGFEPEPPGFQEPIFDHRPIFSQKCLFMSWPVSLVMAPFAGHGPFCWSRPLSLVMAPFAGHGPFRWSWPLSLVMAPFAGHGPFCWSWPLSLVMAPFAGHSPFRLQFLFSMFCFLSRFFARPSAENNKKLYEKMCSIYFFCFFFGFAFEKFCSELFFLFFSVLLVRVSAPKNRGRELELPTVAVASGGFSAPCANRAAEEQTGQKDWLSDRSLGDDSGCCRRWLFRTLCQQGG
jgi:hypothetical protein